MQFQSVFFSRNSILIVITHLARTFLGSARSAPSICIRMRTNTTISPSSSMFKGTKVPARVCVRARSKPATEPSTNETQTTRRTKCNNSNIIIGYNCYYDYNYPHCAFLHVADVLCLCKETPKPKRENKRRANYRGGLFWEFGLLFIFPSRCVDAFGAAEPAVAREQEIQKQKAVNERMNGGRNYSAKYAVAASFRQ